MEWQEHDGNALVSDLQLIYAHNLFYRAPDSRHTLQYTPTYYAREWTLQIIPK